MTRTILVAYATKHGSTQEVADAVAETDVAASLAQLEHGLAKFSEIEPVSVAIFGGAVDPAKLRFPLNRMPASDARDCDEIGAWAAGLAPLLGEPKVNVLA